MLRSLVPGRCNGEFERYFGLIQPHFRDIPYGFHTLRDVIESQAFRCERFRSPLSSRTCGCCCWAFCRSWVGRWKKDGFHETWTVRFSRSLRATSCSNIRARGLPRCVLYPLLYNITKFPKYTVIFFALLG